MGIRLRHAANSLGGYRKAKAVGLGDRHLPPSWRDSPAFEFENAELKALSVSLFIHVSP